MPNLAGVKHKKERILLSQVLPYNPTKMKQKNLRKGLQEYKVILNGFIEAINAFEDGNLEKFDSLVGENACQIRAIKIILIAVKSSFDSERLIFNIKTRQKKINDLLSPKIISSLMHSEISLDDLLEKEPLDIYLTSDEMFILQAYLLTEVKISNIDDEFIPSLYIKEKVAPNKLKRFGDVSSNFLDNLVSRLRKLISAASVQFIYERALKYGKDSTIKEVSDNFIIKHGNLLCIPMFWAYKVILQIVEAENIPLVIYAKFLDKTVNGYRIIDTSYLFYANLKSSGFVHLERVRAITSLKNAFIIQGVVSVDSSNIFPHTKFETFKTQWLLTMMNHPITEVILAGAAHHRQYPNPELEQLIAALKNEEYENYKVMAEQRGFSQINPTTFFIQHVYAAQIKTISDSAAKTTTQEKIACSGNYILST